MPRSNPLIGKWTHLIIGFETIVYGQIAKIRRSEYDVQEGTEIYSVILNNDILYDDGKWYNGRLSRTEETVGISEYDAYDDSNRNKQELLINVFVSFRRF